MMVLQIVSMHKIQGTVEVYSSANLIHETTMFYKNRLFLSCCILKALNKPALKNLIRLYIIVISVTYRSSFYI